MPDLESILEKAKSFLEDKKEHKPIAILELKDKIIIHPIDINNRKDEYDIIAMIVRLLDVPVYWIIMEAWVGKDFMKRPSDDEDRKEALIVQECSKKKGKMITVEFTKDDNGEIVWGSQLTSEDIYSPWNVFANSSRFKGKRFIMLNKIMEKDLHDVYRRASKRWKKEGNENPFPEFDKFLLFIIQFILDIVKEEDEIDFSQIDALMNIEFDNT